jgi:hypothetical protein
MNDYLMEQLAYMRIQELREAAKADRTGVRQSRSHHLDAGALVRGLFARMRAPRG